MPQTTTVFELYTINIKGYPQLLATAGSAESAFEALETYSKNRRSLQIYETCKLEIQQKTICTIATKLIDFNSSANSI